MHLTKSDICIKNARLFRGVGWGGKWEGGHRGREYRYTCLCWIHVNAWQKPTQHCTAITLQLKINKF